MKICIFKNPTDIRPDLNKEKITLPNPEKYKPEKFKSKNIEVKSFTQKQTLTDVLQKSYS